MSRSHSRILEAFASSPAYRCLEGQLPAPGERFRLGGAVGSSGCTVLATLHRRVPEKVAVAVTRDPAAAAAVEADLESLLGQGESYLYPQREALPYESGEPHLEIGGMRVEAVEALFSGRARLLVTTLKALQERAPVPDRLADLRMSLSTGDTLPFQELLDHLETRGFERVPVVEEVGQYAVRGGIVDLFSFGSSDPIRIEFWGDEITSIRLFDILDQRSIRQVETAHVLPVDLSQGESEGETVHRSLLELIPDGSLLFFLGDWEMERELGRNWDHARQLYKEALRQGLAPVPPSDLFLSPDRATALLASFPRVDLLSDPMGESVLEVEASPAIERDMDRLQAFLREGAALRHHTLILCDNDGQAQRLEEILGGLEGVPSGTQIAVGSLQEGFTLHCSDPPLRLLTDHEIFRRSRRVRRGRRFRGGASLESLAQLKPGEYVVHMDHGIGRFMGLERVTIGGEELEALAVEYAGGEVLRVPVYRIDLLERWIGESDDTDPPPVHRIGGRKWKQLRKRTEEAIEKLATELLELYAERETTDGFTYSPDTRWQREMESSFLYEDTPDQRSASMSVKRDMESPRPMDRLVCGDVGYGKTEVAVRAAFKAVQDGKQVAVLAPTTILVEQHRRTFEERLADYPVSVGALSRFRTPKQRKEILLGLAEGTTDVVIGTHRLLSDDVVFRDLGLLVVDEEQRFGVRHKEKLKRLRASVDVLTLTATPIPRTLQLSMAGIRDLTLIQTPPRDRVPIITHVLPWNDQVLGEAIHRELDRGGQVFFLHNRVETIHTAAERVQRFAPEASLAVAHGQMRGVELDKAMREFVDGEVDVLVCSSIIENGLDVPNANTLLVDHADRFGLAQLYQIRGRVGRSDRRAYAYLIVPEEVTEEADARLRVLEHYTELGSGYSIALRDLELRGAGNLLGADQSGFANAVGLDTYLRLLERTVRRIRTARGTKTVEHPEPEVSLDGAALLPDDYISDPGQKLHLYRRLSKVRHLGEVEEIRREMEDRFGAIPTEGLRLLDVTRLRRLGQKLGIERIFVRDREARVSFRAGVVPRLSALERPLTDRQVEVEVRRMTPLSLALHRIGTEPLTPTIIRALDILLDRRAQAA